MVDIQPLTDLREIRKRLTEVRCGRNRVDGRPYGMHMLRAMSPLVSQCMTLAEHEGWSGEDAMTLLAYHALLALERSQDALYEEAMLSPGALIIQTDPPR